MERPASAEQPLETEGALVVCADRPAEVLAAIAALPAIGAWGLEPLAPQAIDDVYYDDGDHSLGRRRVALRIRRVDGEPVLTLKAPLWRDGGVATRLEIEEPWSAGALSRIAAPLGELTRVRTPVPAAAASPEAALRALGLRPVQRRTTGRERRAVLARGGGTIIAELALDSVSYDLPPGPLQLYEIEVEARTDDADVGPILDALAARFDALVPWRHGTLATGFAAERAMRDGALAPGALTPAALELLEQALARD
jgi:inorganic triphosphatase YgiF